MEGLITQICLNYIPFNLVIMLFMVILVIIEVKVGLIRNITTGTH